MENLKMEQNASIEDIKGLPLSGFMVKNNDGIPMMVLSGEITVAGLALLRDRAEKFTSGRKMMEFLVDISPA